MIPGSPGQSQFQMLWAKWPLQSLRQSWSKLFNRQLGRWNQFDDNLCLNMSKPKPFNNMVCMLPGLHFWLLWAQRDQWQTTIQSNDTQWWQTHTHTLMISYVATRSPPDVQQIESCKATTESFAWTVCMATLQAVAFAGHATSPAQQWVGEWVVWWFLE